MARDDTLFGKTVSLDVEVPDIADAGAASPGDGIAPDDEDPDVARGIAGKPLRVFAAMAAQVRHSYGDLAAELMGVLSTRLKTGSDAMQPEAELNDNLPYEMLSEVTVKANVAEDTLERAASTALAAQVYRTCVNPTAELIKVPMYAPQRRRSSSRPSPLACRPGAT